MIFCNWFFKAAIIGSLIAASFAVLVNENQAQINSVAPAQPQQQEASPSSTLTEQTHSSLHYSASCEQPQSREDADLCEQRRMADAAEQAVWWTRAQFWLGVFGAFGLAVTLIFTGLATRSASQQVRLSRHALITTDRAFVHIKSFGWERVVDPTQNNKIIGWNIFVEIENAGNTPTKWCRVSFNFDFRETTIPDDFDFPEMGTQLQARWFLLAPKGAIRSSKKFFNMERANEVANNQRHLYYWGWIEYNDVFEGTPRHRTEFAYKISFGGGKYPEYAIILAEPTPRHNASDDECVHGVMSQPPNS